MGIEIFHANVVHDDCFTETFLEEFRAPLSFDPSESLSGIRERDAWFQRVARNR